MLSSSSPGMFNFQERIAYPLTHYQAYFPNELVPKVPREAISSSSISVRILKEIAAAMQWSQLFAYDDYKPLLLKYLSDAPKLDMTLCSSDLSAAVTYASPGLMQDLFRSVTVTEAREFTLEMAAYIADNVQVQ